MNKLQNIVFPDDAFRAFPELFYRAINILKPNENGEIKRYKCLSFNAYMNALALDKWHKYTNIIDISLNIKMEGEATVRIYNSFFISNQRVDCKLIEKENITSDGLNYTEINIPQVDNEGVIHFEIEYEEERPFQLFDAYFGMSNITDKLKIKIAIVICTFKREAYLQKTLKKLSLFFNQNPEIESFFDILIIDNGQTLPQEVENGKVKLFPNKNTGGAGGFTRGMIEVIRSDNSYSHVLLMDDDIELHTEALFRTFTILSNIKAEFSSALIHGSMMKIDKKNILFETLAFMQGIWVQPWRRDLDVSEYENVLLNNIIPDSLFINSEQNEKLTFSAWWYCCIPTKHITCENLPLPLFLRGDDTEYSVRLKGIHHININGICVWHEPYEYRLNKIVEWYFVPRNTILSNILHSSNFENIFFMIYLKTFVRLLLSYDYNSIALVIEALEDVLSGPEFLRKDQFEILSSLKDKQEKFHVSDNFEEFEQAQQHLQPFGIVKKILFMCSFGGLLLPKSLLKKEGFAVYQFPPIRNIALHRSVKLYHVFNGGYTIREFDKYKMISLTIKMIKNLILLKRRFKLLKKIYKNAFPYYTSIAFWKSYLELSD